MATSPRGAPGTRPSRRRPGTRRPGFEPSLAPAQSRETRRPFGARSPPAAVSLSVGFRPLARSALTREPAAGPSGAAGQSPPSGGDERRYTSRSSHLGTSGSGRRVRRRRQCAPRPGPAPRLAQSLTASSSRHAPVAPPLARRSFTTHPSLRPQPRPTPGSSLSSLRPAPWPRPLPASVFLCLSLLSRPFGPAPHRRPIFHRLAFIPLLATPFTPPPWRQDFPPHSLRHTPLPRPSRYRPTPSSRPWPRLSPTYPGLTRWGGPGTSPWLRRLCHPLFSRFL